MYCCSPMLPVNPMFIIVMGWKGPFATCEVRKDALFQSRVNNGSNFYFRRSLKPRLKSSDFLLLLRTSTFGRETPPGKIGRLTLLIQICAPSCKALLSYASGQGLGLVQLTWQVNFSLQGTWMSWWRVSALLDRSSSLQYRQAQALPLRNPCTRLLGRCSFPDMKQVQAMHVLLSVSKVRTMHHCHV